VGGPHRRQPERLGVGPEDELQLPADVVEVDAAHVIEAVEGDDQPLPLRVRALEDRMARLSSRTMSGPNASGCSRGSTNRGSLGSIGSSGRFR
jgi:hypothetical protein